MAKASSGSSASRLASWRRWVQTGFLLAWLDPPALLGLAALRMHSVCSPVFHCYSCPLATLACPIGILANFSAYHLVPFVALGTLAVAGAIFGSFVCGWACPFGFLQDLVAKIPTPKFTLPDWTGRFRYVVLAVFVLAVPFFFGEASPLFFCRLCPAGALEAAVPYTISSAIIGQPIPWPSAAKIIILVAVLAAMLFTWRPWCTMFCPLGAIYGLCNRISLFVFRFHPDRCRDCAACRSLCQDGGRPEHRAGGMSCVRCLECTHCQAVTVGTVFKSPEKRYRGPQGRAVSSQEH